MTATETAGGVVGEVKQVLYHWWNGDEPALGATHFGVSAQVLIGTTTSDLTDSFDCILCSPSMFAAQYSVANWGDDGFAVDVLPGGQVLPVRGVWLMRSWKPAAFEAGVHRLTAACSPAPDWGELAARIGRVLPWEYDYRHDRTTNQRAGLPSPGRSFWAED